MLQPFHHSYLLLYSPCCLFCTLRFEFDLLDGYHFTADEMDGLVHLTERAYTEQTALLKADVVQLNLLRRGHGTVRADSCEWDAEGR